MVTPRTAHFKALLLLHLLLQISVKSLRYLNLRIIYHSCLKRSSIALSEFTTLAAAACPLRAPQSSCRDPLRASYSHDFDLFSM